MKLVQVDWVDSHGPEDTGWRTVDELVEEGAQAVRCRSVGWLASEANHHKLLIPHLSGIDQDELVPYGKGAITIPDKAIIRMKVLTK